MNYIWPKWIVLVVLLVLAVGGFTVYLFATSPTPRSAPSASPTLLLTTSTAVVQNTQPRITWSPTSTEFTLSPGETASRTVTFTSSVALRNAKVKLEKDKDDGEKNKDDKGEEKGNSSIKPFLDIQPDRFADVPAGRPQNVRLSFSIPSKTAFGTYEGIVGIDSAGDGDQKDKDNPKGKDDDDNLLPETLKVVVNVWQTLTSTRFGFTIKYPPQYLQQEPSEGKMIFSKSAIRFDSDQIAPIQAFVVPTPENGILTYLRSIIVSDYSEQSILIDGEAAQRITGLLSRDFFGWGGRRHGFVLFSHGGSTFWLQYDLESTEVVTVFDRMLNTFRFSR